MTNQVIGLPDPATAEDAVYRGVRNDRGEAVSVTVERVGGRTAEALPERLREHEGDDPLGFEWGYGGTGPHRLARALLLHALGDAAVCATCGGTGYMRSRPEPAAPKGYVIEPYAVGDPLTNDESRLFCPNHAGCDEGWTVVPTDLFVDAYVRGWSKEPMTAWALTRRQILDWLALQQQTVS